MLTQFQEREQQDFSIFVNTGLNLLAVVRVLRILQLNTSLHPGELGYLQHSTERRLRITL